MIRINLVAPERKSKAKDKGPALPAGALQSYLLLALFAGGALVLCAGAWWLQSNKLRDLETRIAADEKRQKDLEAIKQQVDQFQQKKAMLENKVLVIEQLRLAQKSPVHMLDEISKALPDYVWLTALDENRGGAALHRPEQQPGRGGRLHQRPPAQRLVPAGGPRLEPAGGEPRELHPDGHLQGPRGRGQGEGRRGSEGRGRSRLRAAKARGRKK